MAKNKITLVVLITICALLWAYVYISLNRTSLTSGDSPKWIMLARFYRGESVPQYLSPSAYAPVYPLLLAFVITLTNNAILAIDVLGATIFVLFSVSLFAIGRELWDTTGGIMALILGSVGQYFFLYATSWGAYPELLFLTWLNFAVSNFVAIYRGDNLSSKRLLLLGLFLGLGLFTHFPSAIIFLAVFGLPSLHFLLTRMRDLAQKERITILSVFFAPVTAWGAYVGSHLQETLGYLENEAALYTRGVNTVWFYLFRLPESSVFVVLSLAGVVLTLAWASRTSMKEKAQGFYFVSSWLFSTVILMCLLYLIGAKTEYTRFTYFIVPPLVLSLAGALSVVIKTGVTVRIEGFNPRAIDLKKWSLPVILIAILLPFPAINAFYANAIEYYSVGNPDDLRESIAWIGENMLPNDTVLTLQREGRWLEGLTGNPALFSFPERSSYRPWEHERSVSADVLLESSVAVENGLLLVQFQEASNAFPAQPSVAVCREGEYVDAIWLRDTFSKISLITPSGEVQNLLLSDFARRSYEVSEESGTIRLISRFEKGVNQTVLYLDRTITVTSDSPVVSISYELRTATSFYAKGLSIGILDPWGRNRKDTEVGKELRLVYKTATKRDMVIRVAWDASNASVSTRPLSDKDKRPVTWLNFFPNKTSQAKLNLKIITAPTARIINDFRLYEPSQLLENFNVKAALLPKDEALWYEVLNLKSMGFVEVFENKSYIIFERVQNAG